MGAYPGLLAAGTLDQGADEHSDKSGDVHLRSAKEVSGYHIQGSDHAIGHIEDFIVDDETWTVRYLVIDTSNWWFGKKVLLSPHWASRVSWGERKVYVDMSRQAIKDSPEWTATTGVHREFERRLHEYYGRPPYWAGGQPLEERRPAAKHREARGVSRRPCTPTSAASDRRHYDKRQAILGHTTRFVNQESEIPNNDDGFMVVVVDGLHVPIFRVPSWLRLGLSWMGAAISKVFPTTPWVAGGHGFRRFRSF